MKDRKRSKYRVGQVVKLLQAAVFSGQYARLKKRHDDGYWTLTVAGLDCPLHEGRMRPLTAREKGKD